MKFFKVLLLLLTAILCHQSLKAVELDIYTVNGIKYTVYEGEAQVRGLANNNIRNVDIPEKVNIDGQSYPVTTIGWEAFQGCSGITTINIPGSVTKIGEGAFRDCTGITALTIPNSVTEIGEYAFYGCHGIKSLSLSNSLTEIKANTFVSCTGITSLTIPNSVTTIGNLAFSSCTGITSLTLGNSVTSIGESAFYKLGITSLTIPNSVTLIGGAAFSRCTELTSVTIPNSVSKIDMFAFFRCFSLSSVTIGSSVTSIGDRAFSECNALTKIECLAEMPPAAEDRTFEDETYRTAILTVPDRSAQLYRNDAVWCKFGTIFGGAGIDAPVAADGSDGIDYGSPFEVYSTTGQYIGNDLGPLSTGIYIVRQSGRTAKIRK